jgi:hypothetical protein
MIDLSKMKDRHIEALVRVAKTRGRAFFAHPKAMMILRAEHEKRACKGNIHNVGSRNVDWQGGLK